MDKLSRDALAERLFTLSDALVAANEALANIPLGPSPEFDALAEQPLCWGDFADAARKLNAIADDLIDEVAA